MWKTPRQKKMTTCDELPTLTETLPARRPQLTLIPTCPLPVVVTVRSKVPSGPVVNDVGLTVAGPVTAAVQSTPERGEALSSTTLTVALNDVSDAGFNVDTAMVVMGQRIRT